MKWLFRFIACFVYKIIAFANKFFFTWNILRLLKSSKTLESTHWLKCPIIIILIEIEQQFAEHKWDQINRLQKRSSKNRICAVSQSLDKYRLTADQSNWFSTPNKAIKCFMALNVDGCHCSRFFILMTISNRIESSRIRFWVFRLLTLNWDLKLHTHGDRQTLQTNMGNFLNRVHFIAEFKKLKKERVFHEYSNRHKQIAMEYNKMKR